MGYPTPEQREQWKGVTPGTPPPGPAGAASANRTRQQDDAEQPDPGSGT